jgi:polynucleotide 5'-hydroxyl-kinase GRC3/NOL9
MKIFSLMLHYFFITVTTLFSLHSSCVAGVGYDILVDMLKYIVPTHVVKINISAESKNLPAGAFWLDEDCDKMVNLIEINSARQDSYNRS